MSCLDGDETRTDWVPEDKYNNSCEEPESESLDPNFITENSSLRREEYESLKAIYADDHIEFKEWESRFGFSIQINKSRLELVTGPRYPLLEAPLNIILTGLSLHDSVRIADTLTVLAESKRGSIMLFDLIEEARVMTASVETDETDETLDTSQRRLSIAAANLHGWEDYDATPYMKGVTLQMISQRLRKDNVTILHAELVMNFRLVSRFENMRLTFTEKYRRNTDLDQPLSTEVVFHGTQRRFIPSIISRGFIKPGDVMNDNGDILHVRCGSTYGAGIYTSPDPRFSMSYSDVSTFSDRQILGQKLIVCAVLMGRRGTVSRDMCKGCHKPISAYDSHVSPSKFEYIVFNSAQLLPLYVLHVTNGDPNLESYWNRRVLQGPPVSIKQDFDPLAERKKTGVAEIDESETDLTGAMKRKILTKMAKKHFPLGFGPAVGDKFVVEAIGEVDDDEEEWGQYQLDRKGYVREGEGLTFESDGEDDVLWKSGTKNKNLDEFQKARRPDFTG
jgi:hypothetical protein